jgi:ABC-type antimicrobial peptide transport system permease subunit
MGLRLALGALPASLLPLAVRPAARLAVAGVAAGAIASLFLTRFIQALLYGVQPADPRVLLAAALLLAVVALLAALIPALRATRVDPANALRSD